MFVVFKHQPVVLYCTEFVTKDKIVEYYNSFCVYETLPNQSLYTALAPTVRGLVFDDVTCVIPEAFHEVDTTVARETFYTWTVFCGNLPDDIDGLVHEYLFGRPRGNMMSPPVTCNCSAFITPFHQR